MSDILVIDLGTTNLKASVFDAAGQLRTLRAMPMPSHRPGEGRHELAIADLTRAITKLLRGLESALPGGLATIAAVTFSTQTNSFALLDENDDPLTPIIVWDDNRANAIGKELEIVLEVPHLYENTGVPALTHEFMVAKLLWLQREQPETFTRTARLALISDLVTLWMTGQFVTEAGAAGLTGMLDIHTLEWWDTALDRFGLRSCQLPGVLRAGTDLGALRPGIAGELRLPDDCRFVVGCLDQYAGAIGAGNVSPGMISETTGTVLATVTCTAQFERGNRDNIFCGPGFAPGIYYRMVFGNVSANLLEYYKALLDDAVTFSDLDEAAENCSVGKESLALLQLNDADRHDWIRKKSTLRTPGEVTRAILEAVAFALRGQVEALTENDRPQEIVCVGGAARSDLWRKIKADVLGIPTVALDCPEPTSLGAALLALSASTDRPLAELVSAYVHRSGIVKPDPDMYNAYTAMRAAATGES